MRALFTCQPGYGSFYPMVPFAQGLELAGHTVAFATSASFCPVVEAAGFTCFPAGVDRFLGGKPSSDPRAAEYSAVASELPTPWDQWLYFHTQGFRNVLARAMIADLRDIARAWQPALIVRENIEFGGCIVAELMELPHAVASAVEFYPRWVEEAFWLSQHRLRVDHGLPLDPEGLMPHRYLTLTGLPPEWIGPHEVCPPTTHFVRPIPFDHRVDEPAPSWLAALPDRPTVHASLGTIFSRTPGIYEAIIAGLHEEPLTLIVTTGNRDPAEFGPQPDNVYIEPFISHTQLLPHCDLMLTHAGYGSTMAMLMHGVPAVLLPIHIDQLRNAARVAALGAGITLSVAECTPELIREVVRTVLNEKRYRRDAQQIQRRLETLPGVDYAVQLLERLAEHRKPILREA